MKYVINDLMITDMISKETAYKLLHQIDVDDSEIENIKNLVALYVEYDAWNIAINLYSCIDFDKNEYHSCLAKYQKDYNDEQVSQKEIQTLKKYQSYFNNIVGVKAS